MEQSGGSSVVHSLLSKAGLPEYIPLFEVEDLCDMEVLAGVTEEQLQRVGVRTLGQRLRILAGVRKVRERQVTGDIRERQVIDLETKLESESVQDFVTNREVFETARVERETQKSNIETCTESENVADLLTNDEVFETMEFELNESCTTNEDGKNIGFQSHKPNINEKKTADESSNPSQVKKRSWLAFQKKTKNLTEITQTPAIVIALNPVTGKVVLSGSSGSITELANQPEVLKTLEGILLKENEAKEKISFLNWMSYVSSPKQNNIPLQEPDQLTSCPYQKLEFRIISEKKKLIRSRNGSYLATAVTHVMIKHLPIFGNGRGHTRVGTYGQEKFRPPFYPNQVVHLHVNPKNDSYSREEL